MDGHTILNSMVVPRKYCTQRTCALCSHKVTACHTHDGYSKISVPYPQDFVDYVNLTQCTFTSRSLIYINVERSHHILKLQEEPHIVGHRSISFYRAMHFMHFSAYARSRDRMSSVCLSVRL